MVQPEQLFDFSGEVRESPTDDRQAIAKMPQDTTQLCRTGCRSESCRDGIERGAGKIAQENNKGLSIRRAKGSNVAVTFQQYVKGTKDGKEKASVPPLLYGLEVYT